MTNAFSRLIAVGALMAPLAAQAEPIRLKLTYFSSENTNAYLYGVKPFVDAVNAEGAGLVTIEVHSSGALGRALAEQPRFVLEGTADIAWVVPGQTPYRFPDNAAIEQPGLFRDTREGTLVYTRLIAARALRGYDDFFVIGAYMTDPTLIHSREPIDTLAALKGRKIRANNTVEAEALERLGAVPTVLESSKLANAARSGTIDGVAMNPTGLFDFGVAPSAKNHYLLRSGATPLALLMSRQKFDGLPAAAKALVSKYSGERAAAIWIDSYGRAEQASLERIRLEPDRKVVEASSSDLETARRIYRSMIDAWMARSSRNRELLEMVEKELAEIRSGNR